MAYYKSNTLVAHYVTVRLAYRYTMLNPHLYNHRLTSCATRVWNLNFVTKFYEVMIRNNKLSTCILVICTMPRLLFTGRKVVFVSATIVSVGVACINACVTTYIGYVICRFILNATLSVSFFTYLRHFMLSLFFKMLYLIGPNRLVNLGYANFRKMVWMAMVLSRELLLLDL